jgi:polygalacturonase
MATLSMGTHPSAHRQRRNGNQLAYFLFSQGASYWDGEGTNGGVTKPHPMVKITKGGGTFKDVVST